MNINTSLSHRNKEPENSVLYIVGTPIGNLNDLSLRALNILKNVSLIACEDTRQTLKLLNRYEITNTLLSFNMHNSQSRISRIVQDLKDKKSVAIVCDAGMPGICDPGEDLIKSVKANNLEVICIPGPCAAITALVSSGLPSSSFIFMGCSYNDDTSITLLFFISWEGFIVSDLDINKQLLNVNLNSDFNTEASSHSLSTLSANQSPDFWSACQNLLHDNINLVCISNYNVTPENRINYYVFKIDTEQLQRIIKATDIDILQQIYTFNIATYNCLTFSIIISNFTYTFYFYFFNQIV